LVSARLALTVCFPKIMNTGKSSLILKRVM
jgi:hypothetical protein